MAVITCPECGAKFEIPNPDCESVFCPYCGIQFDIAPFVRYASASQQPKHAKTKSVHKKQKAHDEPNYESNVHYNFNYSKSEHTEHIVDDAKVKAAENASRVINIFAHPFEARQKAKEEQKRKEEEAARKQEEFIRQAQEDARVQQEQLINGLKKLCRKVFDLCKAYPKQALASVAVCAALLVVGVPISSKISEHNREVATHKAELARLEEEKIAYSHMALGEVKMPDDIPSNGNYRDAVEALTNAGFTNITTEPIPDVIIGYTTSLNSLESISVSGSTNFKKGAWYPANAKITVRYHTFREEIQQVKDDIVGHVAEKVTDTVNEQIDNAVDAIGNKITSVFSSEPSTGTYAYVASGDDFKVYFYVDFDGSRAYMYTIGNKSNKQSFSFTITDGNYEKGIVVYSADYDVSYDVKFRKNKMTIYYDDGDSVTFKTTDANEAWKLYRDNY